MDYYFVLCILSNMLHMASSINFNKIIARFALCNPDGFILVQAGKSVDSQNFERV